MEIRVKTGALEASFELEEDATFEEEMSAFIAACIAEGYAISSISKVLARWAKKFEVNQNE